MSLKVVPKVFKEECKLKEEILQDPQLLRITKIAEERIHRKETSKQTDSSSLQKSHSVQPPDSPSKGKNKASPEVSPRTDTANKLSKLSLAALRSARESSKRLQSFLESEAAKPSSSSLGDGLDIVRQAEQRARLRKLLPQKAKEDSEFLTDQDASVLCVRGVPAAISDREAKPIAFKISDFFKKEKMCKHFCEEANKILHDAGSRPVRLEKFQKEIYGVFLRLLMLVETEQNLDFLIHKDAKIGQNKSVSERLKHAEIIHQIDVLMTALDKAGIKGVESGKAINFWSGKEGAEKALSDMTAMSDSDVPAFCFLFKCWNVAKALPEGKELIGSLMPRLFSYIFSKYAKGTVDVWMASNAERDGVASMNVDSAFWSTELANLIQAEEVTSVNLHLYDSATKSFLLPIDLKSDDVRVKQLKAKLKLSSRGENFAMEVGTFQEYINLWKIETKKAGLLKEKAKVDKKK